MATNDLQPLNNIFGSSLFRIPDYQRGYAWQKEQLEDFWEDLLNLKDGKDHYTGLLTLKKLNEESEIDKAVGNDKWLADNYEVYHIVDGQQRLTTAIILINEIIKIFEDNNTNVLGKQKLSKIKEKYICEDSGEIPPRTAYIFGYEKDNPSYDCLKYEIFEQEDFSGKREDTTYTKNLKFAKKFFSDKLKKVEEKDGLTALENIFKKLVQNMKFNRYDIDDDYDVYVSFETMNNRGKKLSNLELLKNRLIYLTELFSGENYNKITLRNEINDAWKEIYTWLGKKETSSLNDDDFLRTHWIVYYKTPQKKANEVMDFLLKEKFTAKKILDNVADSEKLSPMDVSNYVKSLSNFVKFYYFIHFPDDKEFKASAEEKVWLKKINRLGIGFFKPLLMVACSQLNEENKSTDLFKVIERFLFVRFALGSRRADMGGSDYFRYAKELNDGNKNFADIIGQLKNDIDSDMPSSIVTFVGNVKELFRKGVGYYGWSSLSHLLFEYEFSLATKNDLEKFDVSMFTQSGNLVSIEHILPQTLSKEWEKDLKKYKNNPEKMATLIGALGNLLLLSQPINASLQNDSFADKVYPPEGKKRRGYSHGSHSELEVVNTAREGNNGELKWTAKEIKLRSENLIDFMIDHWKLTVDDKQRQELVHLDFVK